MNERDEKWLRDKLFSGVHSYLAARNLTTGPAEGVISAIAYERHFTIFKEGGLDYPVDSTDHRFSHKSDFLMVVTDTKLKGIPVLNVEVKFRSSVTDAFKARSYDQIFLKRAHPHLHGIMLYVKPEGKGLSFFQVSRICHPFDEFIFLSEPDLEDPSVWNHLSDAINSRMKAVAADATIPAPFFRETL